MARVELSLEYPVPRRIASLDETGSERVPPGQRSEVLLLVREGQAGRGHLRRWTSLTPLPIMKRTRKGPMKLPAAAFALTFVELALAGSTDQAPVFNQVTIHTDKGPRFVAVADVNHDGKPDL